jgi:integrase
VGIFEYACLCESIYVYWTLIGHRKLLPLWVARSMSNSDWTRAMARKVRDAFLDSRQARGKLGVRGKPHWRQIERGLHLGYRRLRGKAGTWWARHYIGKQQYEVEPLGIADDLSDGDGVKVLDFWQAQNIARERMVARAHAAAGKTGPLKVRDAVEEYLGFLETNRKSAVDARYRAEAFIIPKLGDIEVGALTTERIHKWHVELAKSAARLRTKRGAAQKYKAADNEDALRRRRSTANRTLTILKAALNRAWRAGKASSDAAWRRVEPFENVDPARVRYLTVAESTRLINGSESDFRDLVHAALLTGARYGELSRLRTNDFNPDAGTLSVRQSKSGKPRHVVLTDEGIRFFRSICAGRAGVEIIFKRRSGGNWEKSHQSRPMKLANERAKISPPIPFHGLRHTWASLSVMNGVPLLVVAKNLGHADTRMVERHYGHLAPSFIADAIRAGAPRFGIGSASNVLPMPSP